MQMKEREYQLGRQELRRLHEELVKAQKEAERHAAVAKARPVTTSQKESTLTQEIDKCMVRSYLTYGL